MCICVYVYRYRYIARRSHGDLDIYISIIYMRVCKYVYVYMYMNMCIDELCGVVTATGRCHRYRRWAPVKEGPIYICDLYICVYICICMYIYVYVYKGKLLRRSHGDSPSARIPQVGTRCRRAYIYLVSPYMFVHMVICIYAYVYVYRSTLLRSHGYRTSAKIPQMDTY